MIRMSPGGGTRVRGVYCLVFSSAIAIVCRVRFKALNPKHSSGPTAYAPGVCPARPRHEALCILIHTDFDTVTPRPLCGKTRDLVGSPFCSRVRPVDLSGRAVMSLFRLVLLALALVSTSGLHVSAATTRVASRAAAAQMKLPAVDDARNLSTDEIEKEITNAKKVRVSLCSRFSLRSRAVDSVHRTRLAPPVLPSPRWLAQLARLADRSPPSSACRFRNSSSCGKR